MIFLRRFLLLVFVLTAIAPALAQTITLEDQLPVWAQRKWNVLAKTHALKLSARMNPFILRGDFDGDGRQDLAVLVQHVPTGKEGIVILPRRNVPALVLGAGKTFGNGGDDFAWIDLWNVENRGTLQRSYYEKAVRLRADGLLVAKEASASALIYLDNGKPRWQQQGD